MKKTKVKNEKVGYFIDKNNRLISASDNFVYETQIYHITKRCVELHDSKIKEIKEFRGFHESELIEKKDSRFMKYTDLLSAPVDFLVKHNFKSIS